MNYFKINKATLFYTNICNFKCKHCFVSPLFNGKKTMDELLFEKSLNFCVTNKIQKISISGGEPMLFWNQFKNYIKDVSQKNNIYFSICTNAYWAKITEERLMIIDDLKKHGVRRLEISTDSYHQEFIDLKTITSCITDAQNKGLDVIVTVCFDKLLDEFNTISEINRTILSTENLRLKFISSFGEAKKNCIDTVQDISFIEKYKCNQIGSPIITYTGDVYACCGPAFTLDDNNFYLGNIQFDTIEKINLNLYCNEKIKALKNSNLINLVSNYKELFSSRKISSSCELCIHFMNS
ncbi:radical SAM protein [Desnuesiella massiliensis]|uniref:radical SAM protein n=1 Tax=Desnuesiella massiliensis TaxID=1650662 RepID=UPI0006E390B4|nr:radical SAM protein [Desnuesiella massiliensis]